MRHNSISAAALLCCTVSALAMPATASAQEAAANPAGGADTQPTDNEIVVTATRQEQSLQETSMTVDVVTGEDLRNYNIIDVKDIQKLAPGLELTNNDGRSNVATLRGVTHTPDSGTSPAVEVYINEIAADAQTAFTAVYDIGQIEVLRGPQGIFRGKTSPAGAILIGTARPDLNDPTGYAQLTGTTENAINFQGAASLPIVQGHLALRAAMLMDNSDVSSVKNVDGRNSTSHTISGRVSLAYDSGSALRANLMYQYLNEDKRPYVAVFGPGNQPSLGVGDPSASGPPITLDDRLSVTEGIFRFENKTNFVTLNSSYDLGAAEVVLNAGYQDTALVQNRDQDTGNSVPNYTNVQSLAVLYKVYNAELRLQSTGDSRLTWSLSGNHTTQKNRVPLTQKSDLLFGTDFLGPLPPFGDSIYPINVAVEIDTTVTENGLAGLLGYELFDNLTVTGGLRHTWIEIGNVQTTDVELVNDGIFLPTDLTTSNTKDSVWTGGANINWGVTPDLNVYASYGRAFRPGATSVGVTVPLDPSLLFTDGETSDGYEVGVKTTLFGGKGTLNLAAFYQKFDNYISYNPGVATDAILNDGTSAPGSDGIVDSFAPLSFTGDAIVKGLEMQFNVRPSDNFDFGLSASYADGKYDNAEIPCNDFNNDGVSDSTGTPAVQPGKQVSTCISNNRVAQVPKFSMTTTGEFRIPTGSVEPFIRGLVSYRPGFVSPQDNYDYRAFTRVDLFAGLRGGDGAWEIVGFVRNLLDQTRALAVSQGNAITGTTGLDDLTFQPNNRAGPAFDSGYRTATITTPREFGLTLKYNW